MNMKVKLRSYPTVYTKDGELYYNIDLSDYTSVCFGGYIYAICPKDKTKYALFVDPRYECKSLYELKIKCDLGVLQRKYQMGEDKIITE